MLQRFLLILILNFIVFSSRPLFAADIRDSVVKIYTTTNRIDYYHPWQTKGSQPAIGSGCVIGQNRILTNAHVVSDQTFIQVKKHSSPKKYTAKILAIGNDCDLAILQVDDKDFFEGVSPLEIGELPSVQDKVNVFGYPTGGDDISVTEGVISRMEVTKYAHSYSRLLALQIDAALNPGNSGGPVLKDGKLVGIAMQTAFNAENIGYIIPTTIIDHFLHDIEDGHFDGFPVLGIEFNQTDNPALREYYKIKDKQGGILLSKILPGSPADGQLKEGDVVTEIDHVPIAEDGTFAFSKMERLWVSYLISKKQMGESINLKLVRNGEEKSVSFPLFAFDTLVPSPYAAPKPSYFIYGGFVFTVLTADLLKEWWDYRSDDRMRIPPLDFVYYYYGLGRLNEENKKEIVVMLTVLPDDINIGYHNYSNLIIAKVNGKKFFSFKEFVQILSRKEVPYTIFETKENARIILKNDDMDRIDQEILSRNNISQRFSQDVADWLGSQNTAKK